MFYVLVEPRLGQPRRIHGPFSTAARASGFGFSTYGAIRFGGVRWGVHPGEAS